METAIALLVLVLVAGLVLALVRRMKTTQRVTVLEDLVLGGDARTVEPAVVTALSSIKGAEYLGAAGLHAVVLRRIPVWAIVPVFLLFPIGLVCLFIRESVRLDISLFDGPDGAVLRLSGQTERFILDQVRAAADLLIAV